MAVIKVHFDGWVALPEAFRRQLGLATGAELEAELVAGTVVLRPRARAKQKEVVSREMPPVAAAAAEGDSAVTLGPEASSPESAGVTAVPAEPSRRKPGRKATAADEGAAAADDIPKVKAGRAKLGAALAPARRTRGRKASGATGVGALPT